MISIDIFKGFYSSKKPTDTNDGEITPELIKKYSNPRAHDANLTLSSFQYLYQTSESSQLNEGNQIPQRFASPFPSKSPDFSAMEEENEEDSTSDSFSSLQNFENNSQEKLSVEADHDLHPNYFPHNTNWNLMNITD
jgi:hypothetical protein